MNILYIIDLLDKMGGAERNLLQLVMGFKERGKHTPIVCSIKGGQLADTLSKYGTEVIDLQLKRIYSFAGFKAMVKLVRFIRDKRIDLIVTYHDSSDFLGFVLSRICSVPIISSRRDTGFNLKRRHIITYRFINKFFHRIITVSEAVKMVVAEKQLVDPQEIKVIYNGIDLSKFSIEVDNSNVKKELGLKDGQSVIGCLANLRRIKGHTHLVEAAGRVLKEIADVRFLLVGEYDIDEGYYQEIICILEEMGIKKNVIFLGGRDDVQRVLSVMDISVNCSLSEGFSNTILEAMAAGKPVVATNVGGNPEAVLDGKTGILVPPADSMSLANAIISLLKDATLAGKMGEGGRKRVESEFSLEKMIRENEELYESVF